MARCSQSSPSTQDEISKVRGKLIIQAEKGVQRKKKQAPTISIKTWGEDTRGGSVESISVVSLLGRWR